MTGLTARGAAFSVAYAARWCTQALIVRGSDADERRLRRLLWTLGIPVALTTGKTPYSDEVALVTMDGVLMHPTTATSWIRMRDAARADGVALFVRWGYRSWNTQAQLVRRQLVRGKPLKRILKRFALPGYSQHHTGRALDLAARPDGDNDGFERTPSYRWLCGHAGEFGFRLSFPAGNPDGIKFEPWHWYQAE